MPLFYALTLFLSASLLFMVQPMVGRMVLPLLGGTPAVWNTCMLFFQILLLLGYIYAHVVGTRLALRQQVKVHLGVLGLAFASMLVATLLTSNHSAIAVLSSLSPQGLKYPYLGILAVLTVAIGLPFFAVSTSAPLLQKWFSESGHPSAKDPYFLYSASNIGSLIALLGYPFFIESMLVVRSQTWMWAFGFGLLAIAIYQCSQLLWRQMELTPPVKPLNDVKVVADDSPAPSLITRLKWIALSFVPSSLMLSVTTYITTDIASLALLWVIPLSLYLISFIIAFAKMPPLFMTILTLCAPVFILLLLFMMNSGNEPDYAIKLLLHVINFGVLAIVCHGELARQRPSTKYLTEFYLWMSVGGMLGGLFNGLIAPLVFNSTFEYQITLVIACLVLPKLEVTGPSSFRSHMLDIMLPLVVYILAIQLEDNSEKLADVTRTIQQNLKIPFDNLALVVIYGFPAMIAYFFVERPVRFALTVALLFVFGYQSDMRFLNERMKLRERSFFGVLKVESDELSNRLVHGTTLHGTQNRYALEFQIVSTLAPMGLTSPMLIPIVLQEADEVWRAPLGRTPETYYHRTGPVGSIFKAMERVNPKGEIGMIGLGTGSLTCYLKPGQRGTIFEIDTKVVNIVENLPEPSDPYFTYLKRAREQGAIIEYQMGDARLKLEEVTDRKFSVLLVDAFSSDAIPVHLLTLEALKLYFDRVEADGFVCLHISNRHLNLEFVCERLARELGVTARVMNDGDDQYFGKTASTWVVMTRTEKAIEPLTADPRWTKLDVDEYVPVWTDDFSSLLSVLRFKQVRKFRAFFGMGAPVSDDE
ncbi:class I SAM-dependent methyltransferase [Tuwongella immobilis]|uniref:PABS domain-containing protein n=1 Tax=Tuwongella immobilis TaxID=692036 RepID=A0A6C2YP29_9BACT|nr:spermidine synthase [Tuwongella immobilis]VIP03378.1 Uncharacterized protein OS=Methylomicrobium alcaliphilum (strain DSM 19304 / NCIMB 14124 / VKM B-2133 / 20Z) GN=MEALZ_2392 PE=4 SV=1 [Tuwongella immobilis]VTS04128.1 Uncharacterized protein OS=Methylomicrobium alcaliphilum (strain DSM 19304 / NCIMB 14124 / VKM B-2133 / 20Z) GN=MEALZ_2392 PE=4 SV=1 [Tuwongella immobilis]